MLPFKLFKVPFIVKLLAVPPVIFNFVFKAVCVAVLTGLFKSDVLSTFPKPTVSFVSPNTASLKFTTLSKVLIPVNVLLTDLI